MHEGMSNSLEEIAFALKSLGDRSMLQNTTILTNNSNNACTVIRHGN